jgi:hypothetical protein
VLSLCSIAAAWWAETRSASHADSLLARGADLH